MQYEVNGKIMELVKCEKCGAMKVDGKKCGCEKRAKELNKSNPELVER